jgi:hypothetical protein
MIEAMLLALIRLVTLPFRLFAKLLEKLGLGSQ